MFDLHCHILPQIDDGSELLETSGEMAKALLKAGVTHVVATPHLPGLSMVPLSRDRIAERYTQLVTYLEQQNIPLKLFMSAEHNLNPILLQNEDQYLVPFGSGEDKTLLVEMPWQETPKKQISKLIFELQSRGYALLLAHPERSPGYDVNWLADQVSAGNFYLQLEATSLFGAYGQKAKAKALELIKKHLVHVMASDSHNVSMCRDMGTAIEEIKLEYGDDVTRLLFEDNPQALISGNYSAIHPL